MAALGGVRLAFARVVTEFTCKLIPSLCSRQFADTHRPSGIGCDDNKSCVEPILCNSTLRFETQVATR